MGVYQQILFLFLYVFPLYDKQFSISIQSSICFRKYIITELVNFFDFIQLYQIESTLSSNSFNLIRPVNVIRMMKKHHYKTEVHTQVYLFSFMVHAAWTMLLTIYQQQDLYTSTHENSKLNVIINLPTLRKDQGCCLVIHT